MKKLVCILSVFLLCAFSTGFSAPPQTDYRELPVLMYHSILKSAHGKYIQSPMQLELDLCTLLQAGYQTVTAKQLIDFVDNKGDLPKKPILITFDDGFYNNLFYALPILKKLNCHAIVNVVGKFTDDTERRKEEDHPNYSYLTWKEIAEISEDGYIEIGNHTYNMHGSHPRLGVGRIKGESDQHYAQTVLDDIKKQQDLLTEVLGVSPICFAYPYGNINDFIQSVVESIGFRLTLTCNEGSNIIKQGDPHSLLRLKRYNRGPSKIKLDGVCLN